jgi:hypothetical protein
VFFFEYALSKATAFLPVRWPKNGDQNKAFENSNYHFAKSRLGGKISLAHTITTGESYCRSGILDQAAEM